MELYYGNRINKPSSNNKTKGMDCPYWGQSSQTELVHAHEQSVLCKTNGEPCCHGRS